MYKTAVFRTLTIVFINEDSQVWTFSQLTLLLLLLRLKYETVTISTSYSCHCKKISYLLILCTHYNIFDIISFQCVASQKMRNNILMQTKPPPYLYIFVAFLYYRTSSYTQSSLPLKKNMVTVLWFDVWFSYILFHIKKGSSHGKT